MHKLDKYATSLIEDKDKNIIRSTRSNYYNFGGHILRISDHIGANSSGALSIVKTQNPDIYVIHRHVDGNIRIATYKETKNVLKGFTLLAPVLLQDSTAFELEGEEMRTTLMKACEKNGGNPNTILGIPKTAFTKGQLKTIQIFVNQNKKK